jgi:hypothetical protein
MPSKSPLTDGLIAKLHGRSSMSEILLIEKQRLMKQAAEEMRVQLDPGMPRTASESAPVVTYQPANLPGRSDANSRPQEGLSTLSRFAGEDLAEFDDTFTHSAQTIVAPPSWPADPYYQELLRRLPFSSQRDLLEAICLLTIGWGNLRCRITLSLLAAASGIRNVKTLRKWLADLHRRRHIRYIPVHGDLRGSIIELTPPEEIRLALERSWRATHVNA